MQINSSTLLNDFSYLHAAQKVDTKTVLIVDDDPTNIRLLTSMLKIDGYHIIEAQNGKEALESLYSKNPDLILLDIMMPGMNGFEVCRALKQDKEQMMVPVIMVTALQEKEDRIKAIEAGADDFISKPVDKTELLTRVRSLLRIKTYYDELDFSLKEIKSKNEELVRLEEIKQGLTHMIIHDLRSPLMCVSATLQLMQKKYHDLPIDFTEEIENCVRFCLDLDQMIQSLLDIHKMESGKLELTKKSTEIKRLILECVQQLSAKAELRNISFEYSIDGKMPKVEVDRSLIKRVIGNLLGNAIRHSPVGENIIIGVDFDTEKRGIRISVRDGGEGIPPEALGEIFNKFYQVKNKDTKTKSGSCGLGLAFCKMAVEAHGGEIWAKSGDKKQGSSFNLILPVDTTQIPEVSFIPNVPRELAGKIAG